MQIRDRVKELRRVRAGDLRPNPRNWRAHPTAQRNALCGLLAEIGFAGAVLARELADGSLELIDGHLRAEILPDSLVPVLVLDVDEGEARKLLALLDPISALAETRPQVLLDLLGTVESQNDAVNTLLSQLAGGETQRRDPPEDRGIRDKIAESYQVIVDCRNEAEQRQIYERLTNEGFRCRVLTL